jgi:hypothetical protein
VLVIRVGRSYNPPHRITRQGSNRFWARSAAGKYEPDVNELRTLFNAGPQLADRIRNFRVDRIAKIAAGEAPVRLMNRSALIVHVVPLSAFDATSAIPLREIELDFLSFVPIGSSTASSARINFDGILKTSGANQQHRAYIQLYRNGIVETVDSALVSTKSGTAIVTYLDDKLIEVIMRSLKDVAAVGIEPPYALLVSLIGVSGAQLNFARGEEWFENLGNPFDREQYHFEEVIVETVPTDHAECARIIRPILDQVANTGGRAMSPVFDSEGHYISK